MKKALYPTLLILALLHQDFWNWGGTHLYLGFLPSGLAYHAAYTLVVVIFWCAVVRFAWPHELEEFAVAQAKPEKPRGDKGGIVS